MRTKTTETSRTLPPYVPDLADAVNEAVGRLAIVRHIVADHDDLDPEERRQGYDLVIVEEQIDAIRALLLISVKHDAERRRQERVQ